MKPGYLLSFCTLVFLFAAQPGAAATGNDVMIQFHRLCISNLLDVTKAREAAERHNWKKLPSDALAKLGWRKPGIEAWGLQEEGERYLLRIGLSDQAGKPSMACSLYVFNSDMEELIRVLSTQFNGEIFMEDPNSESAFRAIEAEWPELGRFIVLVHKVSGASFKNWFTLTSFFIE